MNFTRHLTGPKRLALLALTAALATTPVVASAKAPKWEPLRKANLEVTSGKIDRYGNQTPAKPTLHTASSGMRAVERDSGEHATRAKLWFRYLGESTETKPLGSGIIRRQIGLKLQANDPCNLVYVMWRSYPSSVVSIQVKQNFAKDTSADCGNGGYTTIADIPVATATSSMAHTLEARTRRNADGSLGLAVYTDGALLRQTTLSAALTAGLDGPIGIRSDNGEYVFRLSAAGRP
jgi:hypothetical protein